MGCKPQQKMLNNRQLDDICLIQSCQPAPIIINQIQVKTASFSKQYQLFPEEVEPNNTYYSFEDQTQNISNIAICIYSDSSENVSLGLINMIDNSHHDEIHEDDKFIQFNRQLKSRKRSTKTTKSKTKVNMEMLESIF